MEASKGQAGPSVPPPKRPLIVPRKARLKKPKAPVVIDENKSSNQAPVVDAPGADQPPPPSKKKNSLVYKLKKRKVGGTSKVAITPIKKGPSSQKLES